MNKKFLLILPFLLFTGCAVQSTQDFGERVDATSEVVETSLCGTQTFTNLDRAVTNVLRVVPFFAEWEPVCQSDD